MQEHNIFENIQRVKAPESFEQDVLQLLYERKSKQGRRRTLHLSLAWAFSAAVAVFAIVNFVIIPQRGPSEFADLEGEIPAYLERRMPPRGMDTIPIIERVDYSGEMRTSRQEPPTIYLLEQCSDKTSQTIKY
ncbi:MAG: hypothetical protein JSV17_03590 [Candidatus Aminicenantes bacterium]|nr:MAG: hypothetical protein JSV17_03590 [Candidatus Aminicenantes bacterium]